ncbi:histidine kinase [Sphingobium sp. SCG-1]|uniref:glycosyltransferase n=1 Tax=Sphingobium sp. SCG-1 TaxID=2072936 RepID=UPI000CD68322|nr:glycosyltransferase [Sphingobium sp. SCG-1]AUW59835.1 histidine kinase [Sphingobium sp. SCG-1]
MIPVYIIVAIACFGLFLHPYVTFPLSLRLMRARPVRKDATARTPSATMLFSAYNEERTLPAKLHNIEEIRALHSDIAVLAYSDMSTDGTREMLLSRPDLLTLVPSTERTGKATGMRRMVAQADSDICIFTDANVILDPASVARLLEYFRDPAIGGVSGTLRYINEADGVTASVGGLYWRLEEKIKALESRCGSMMGADGSIFATRRALYPDVPPHLLDDMTASISVLFHGQRLISAPDVLAFEKTTTDARDEFRRKRRIACRAFNTHRHLWPQIVRHFPAIDIYKYVSHKLLRWFGAPVLLIALISTTLAFLAAGLPWIAGALWIAGVLALLIGRVARVPLLSPVTEILLSIGATFLGVIDAMRGRTYQTWAPAKSRD